VSFMSLQSKLVRGSLLLLIALGIFAGSGALLAGHASAQDSGLYRAIKSANIRSKPSSNGEILVTAPRNAVVSALGPTKGCGAESCAWVKVAFDGVEGWSKGSYFEPSLVIKGTASADVSVDLHSSASYGSTVKLTIPAGGEMVLAGKQSYPFVYVSYDGVKGWVDAGNITSYPAPQL
jgi:hypothetical protein